MQLSLSDAVKAEMRAITADAHREAGAWLANGTPVADADRASGLGPDRGIPIGSVGERGAQRQEAMMAVLRGVRRGLPVGEAAELAKAEMRVIVDRHNGRRPRDKDWEVGPAECDALIDRTAARLAQAASRGAELHDGGAYAA